MGCYTQLAYGMLYIMPLMWCYISWPFWDAIHHGLYGIHHGPLWDAMHHCPYGMTYIMALMGCYTSWNNIHHGPCGMLYIIALMGWHTSWPLWAAIHLGIIYIMALMGCYISWPSWDANTQQHFLHMGLVSQDNKPCNIGTLWDHLHCIFHM